MGRVRVCARSVLTIAQHDRELVDVLCGKKKDADDQARAEALEWLCTQYYVEIEAIVIAACTNSS